MRKPWREMTEEEKDRVRARLKRYRQRPEVKAKQYERHKRWNEKNRERRNETDRKWYARKRLDDEWIADRVAKAETWREENRERYRKTQRKAWKMWTMLHPDYYSEWRTNRRLLFARDSKAYAAKREKDREYWRRKAEREGREYKPRMSIRIPDWCVFGQCAAIARGSAFLRENMSDERRKACDGYALELAIERRAWRERGRGK